MKDKITLPNPVAIFTTMKPKTKIAFFVLIGAIVLGSMFVVVEAMRTGYLETILNWVLKMVGKQ